MPSRSQRHKLLHQKIDSSGKLYDATVVIQPLTGETITVVSGATNDKNGRPSRHPNTGS